MDLSSRKVYPDSSYWPGFRVRNCHNGVLSSEGQPLHGQEDHDAAVSVFPDWKDESVEFFSNDIITSIKRVSSEPYYWRGNSVLTVVRPDGLPGPLLDLTVSHVLGSEDWTLDNWRPGLQIQAGEPKGHPSLVADYYEDGAARLMTSGDTMCVFGSVLKDSEDPSVWDDTAYLIRLCLIGDRMVGCVSSSKSPSEKWHGDKKKNGSALYGGGGRIYSVFFSTETDVQSMSYLPSECRLEDPIAVPRETVPHFGVTWEKDSGRILQLGEGEFYAMGYNPDDSSFNNIIEDGEEVGGLLSHAFKGNLLDASNPKNMGSWVKPKDLETTLELVEGIKKNHDKLRSTKSSPRLAFRNLIRAGGGFWEALGLA